MDYIVMKTGERYNVKNCGSILDTLYIKFVGLSLYNAVYACSSEESVSRILYYYQGGILAETYQGFTVITDAVLEDETTVRITLKRPEHAY